MEHPPVKALKKERPMAFRAQGKRDASVNLSTIGYGIGKYLEKRLNINGTERIEKTKLARIN